MSNRMQETAEQSAQLKQSLKHDPVTLKLRAAGDSPEGDESIEEVQRGFDTCSPGSWVAEEIAKEESAR